MVSPNLEHKNPLIYGEELLKTLGAYVVKSLFAVLSNLSLKVLKCHRRQTKCFFRNFPAVFCAVGVPYSTCQVWCKLRHKWPNYQWWSP